MGDDDNFQTPQPHLSQFFLAKPDNMENDRGELVDLYVPRKCSATNRIIKAKDHGSVQISVAKVDENGRYTGENQVYALCGFVRAMGERRLHEPPHPEGRLPQERLERERKLE